MYALRPELILLGAVPAAVSPEETRPLLELLGALLGVTKWPVLGLAVVAGGIAVSNHKQGQDEQSAGFWAALVVACGAAGWFLAGVLGGD